jgi:cell division protein FtsW (lipid II flippase)
LTQIASPSRARMHGFTPSGLRRDARALHTPRVSVLNVGLLCVFSALGLSVLGVITINTTEPGYALRQILFLCVGVPAAACIAFPHYRWLQRISYPLFLIVLLMLIFVLIPMVPEAMVRPRNGSRRWINLGVTDFQPSELAKIAYVLALATYLRYRDNYRNLVGLLSLLGMTFIPLGLVLKEPDLGTSLLFLPTLFAMLIAAGARIRHIVLIIVIGLSAAPMMYPFLQPHQKNRIKAMIAQVQGDPRYEDDIGYQGARAMTLVGSGRLFGAGREKSADLVHYNHLPENHNDMVFAVVCCRWGLLGALATWGLFAMFCAGGLWTAALCKDPFGRLVAVGIVAVIFAQMLINTGMNIGLLPITGITLPFVSYGGSSLVAKWFMVGLLFNIAMRRPQYMARKSFEFDDADQ